MKKIEYQKGSHYSNYLKVEENKGQCYTRVTKVKKTKYGYLFHMFNTYVTLFYGKMYINSDGTAKATIKVYRNYRTPYQYTLYFDKQGFEIKTEENSIRKELSIYNLIRKQ